MLVSPSPLNSLFKMFNCSASFIVAVLTITTSTNLSLSNSFYAHYKGFSNRLQVLLYFLVGAGMFLFFLCVLLFFFALKVIRIVFLHTSGLLDYSHDAKRLIHHPFALWFICAVLFEHFGSFRQQPGALNVMAERNFAGSGSRMWICVFMERLPASVMAPLLLPVPRAFSR